MPSSTLRFRSIAAGVVCVMGALAAHGGEAETAQAVWRAQEIKFVYGDTSGAFSCGNFTRKVTRILKALGATDSEVIIDPADCSSGIERPPTIAIKVRSPALATPEVLAAAEGQQPFAATWKRVSLSRGRMGIETTDCVMIDHLRQLVLPHLAVRVVDDGINCLPYAFSQTQPKFIVEALTAK